MKKIVAASIRLSFLFAFVFNLGYTLHAQTDSSNTFSLQLCCNKTSSIVFPQIIKSIDRGSKDLLLQKVTGAENVLQLKAAKENFTETNITIITADGKLWSFAVCYAAEPAHLQLFIDTPANVLEKIAEQKKIIHGIKDNSYSMMFCLKGIYIQSDVLYYALELSNRSNIAHDIDRLNFYIKDKQQSKRTASQEVTQKPLTVYGNTLFVPAQSNQTIVVALTKFTIPDRKNFYITVSEMHGGRHLQLKIGNRRIVKATPIYSLK